jgi:hypothetical protein
MLTSACHCTGCQRMTGSAFSTTVTVPSDGFEVTDGKTELGGLRGPQIRHHHCPDCSSWVFTRVEGMDAFVNLRATMLDDPSWFSPFAEFYTSEMLPWAATPAVHSFEKFPEFETYADLAAEYAAGLRSEEERHG